MSIPVSFDDMEESANLGNPVAENIPTPLQLKLVSKKIPMKFCDFQISNTANKMHVTESVSISSLGVMFNSPLSYNPGTLMRIWIEMPDYWARKSRHVGYRHTDAPTYFQILSRVVSVEEIQKRNNKYQIMCQNVNMDPVDEVVLNDYLGVGAR